MSLTTTRAALAALAFSLPASVPAALAAQGTRPATALTVRAENRLAIARPDETIGVPWAELRAQLPAAREGFVRVRDVASGGEVVSQVVDDDGDGTPDELVFQASFAPGEVHTFAVEAAAPAPVSGPARVYAKHIEDRDDVAWESDRIGWRIYGRGLWKVDSLDSSGIDVWVKRVRTPIIDKWYAKGHDAYHRDTGEGADFFDVGQSLGAGGTGIWRDGTMYRAHNFTSWRIIANGPVRAIFELQYAPWDSAGLRVSETKRISVDAGQNFSRAVSIFRSDRAADIPYVIGLVKRPGVVGTERTGAGWAWLSEWGPVSPKDGGHGDLGTAVFLESSRRTDWKESGDHYFAVAHARSGEPVVHWVGAGWTGSRDFRDVQDWWSYLEQLRQKLESPLVVTVSRGGPPAAASR